MVNGNLPVVIDNEAKIQLKSAFNYINTYSPQNASNFKIVILKSIKELSKNPHIYPPDKYRQNNDSSFRAFEILNYRITYHISADRIIVIRIRHTKRNPFTY